LCLEIRAQGDASSMALPLPHVSATNLDGRNLSTTYSLEAWPKREIGGARRIADVLNEVLVQVAQVLNDQWSLEL